MASLLRYGLRRSCDGTWGGDRDVASQTEKE